jgi:hypothetical protein
LLNHVRAPSSYKTLTSAEAVSAEKRRFFMVTEDI